MSFDFLKFGMDFIKFFEFIDSVFFIWQIKFSSNEKVFQKVFSNSKILDIFQVKQFYP